MLVWTQSIYGIEEKPAIRFPRLDLSRVSPRWKVILSFAPIFAVVAWRIWNLHAYYQISLTNVAVFFTLILLSKYLVIRLYSFSFDLEPVVMIASMVVIGPFWTCVNEFAGTLWYMFFMEDRKRTYSIVSIFNLEIVVIYIGTAGIIYSLFSSHLNPFFSVLIAGCVAFSLNAGLVSIWLSAIRGKNIFENWRASHFTFICYVSIVGIPIGYILGLIFAVSPILTLLFIPPFILLYYTFKSNFDIQHEVGVALQAIGDILEERDEYTFGHTLRVAEYSHAIAKEMGIKSEDVEICVVVGRLHDIGKIAVSDDVLKKEGALSKDEYREIQKHVRMIPELFPHMDQFGKLLHLAMYHHEKYDGTGYPFGLKGEQIPIEARIVAVADAWDAMTSQRVYRAGLSDAQALKILQDYAGKQWDPAVIAAFLQAYNKGLCRPPRQEAA